MTIIKEVIFDETQRNILGTVTILINIKRFLDMKTGKQNFFIKFKKRILKFFSME